MKRSKFVLACLYFFFPLIAYAQNPDKPADNVLDSVAYQVKDFMNVFSISSDFAEFMPPIEKKIFLNLEFVYEAKDQRLSSFRKLIEKKLERRISLLNEHSLNENETKALFDWVVTQIEVNLKKKLQSILDLANTNSLLEVSQNDAEQKKIPIYKDLLVKVRDIRFAQTNKIDPFQFVLNIDQKNLNAFTSLYKLKVVLRRSDGFVEGVLTGSNRSQVQKPTEMSFLVDENKTDEMPEEVQSSLAQLVFGYVPATLTYELIPKDAQIDIEGSIEKPDSNFFGWLEPKSYKVLIYRQSYLPQVLDLGLESGKNTSMSIQLEKTSSKSVIIEADPTANLYDGGNYVGVSPQKLDRENNGRILYANSKDHQTSIFLLDPKDESRQIELTASSYDPLLALDDARDQMYGSLGEFAISLFLPIVFDGLLSNQLSILGNSFSNVDEKNASFRLASTYYYSKNIGILVSIGFGIRSFVKIVDYLHTADQLGLK